MKMQIQSYIFVVLISVIYYSYGLPTSTLQEKLRKLRNFNQHLTAFKEGKPQSTTLFNPMLRGSNHIRSDTKEVKMTFNLEEVLAECQSLKGQDRKRCVTSIARRKYPEHFKGHKRDHQSRGKDKSRTEGVTLTTTTTPNPACQQYIETTTTTTTTTTTVSPIVNKGKHKGVFKHDNKLSAVLITPGSKRKVFPITEQAGKGLAVNTVQPYTQEPLICLAEDLGYGPEIEAKFTFFSLDMLCALCQHQQDQACIIRYCVNQGLVNHDVV